MPSIHQREIKTMTKNELFKCTEKEGFYSVSDPVSEQDIIAFAKTIIATRFKRGTAITSPQASTDYLLAQIGHYEHEVFAALFLDSKHRIIKFEELFWGTIDQASVYTREVAKRALHNNAAAIIFTYMDVGKGREQDAEALPIITLPVLPTRVNLTSHLRND